MRTLLVEHQPVLRARTPTSCAAMRLNSFGSNSMLSVQYTCNPARAAANNDSWIRQPCRLLPRNALSAMSASLVDA